MTALFDFLRSKAGGAAVILLLAFLVILVGPLIGLTTFVCYGIAIALVLVYFIYVLVQKILARRKAKMLEGYLSTQAREDELMSRPDLKDEIRTLREKMETALRVLRRASGSRWKRGDALYVLPWYMIIGRPAAGKTTLLRNSGMSFPAADGGEEAGIRGFGGTRNCDWWFTNDGIFLDTAGRYTAEGGAQDQAEWGTFLGMLKKARKKAPINGLILAVGFDELLSRENVEAEARMLRGRIDELVAQLGIVFPVYLVFTKCDLLHGFVNFFGDFGRKEREQVWGMTFELYGERRLPVYKQFEEEFDRMYDSLVNRRNALLETDKNSLEKQGVYLFPLEFAEIKSKLSRFLDVLFESSRFQQDPAVRGIYFTSGTQGEGTVIDAVIRKMGSELGLSAGVAGLLAPPTEKKAYFIKEFFQRIVLFDRGYVSPSTRSSRKLRFLRLAALGGEIFLSLALLAAFLVSFFKNQSELKETYQAAGDLRSISGNPVRDVETLEPLFHRLEKLDGWESSITPLSLHWGLYSGRKTNAGARQQFLKKLRYLVLEPCHSEFEKTLGDTIQALANSDEYADAFASYRMLSEPYDPAQQPAVLAKEVWRVWSSRIPPERREDWQRLLSGMTFYYWKHRADDDLTGFTIRADGPVVRMANAFLSPRYGPQQFYRRMIAQANSKLPELKVEDLIPGARFLRGNPLPGGYTQDGWDKTVSKLIDKSPEDVQKDPILKANVARMGKDIREELKRLYREDFRDQWKNFLAGVQVGPFPDLDNATSEVAKLADKNSEIMDFLRAALKKGELSGGDFEKQVASEFRTMSEFVEGDLKNAKGDPANEAYLKGLAAVPEVLQGGIDGFKKKSGCGDNLKELVNGIASHRDDATRPVVWDALGVKAFLQKPFEAAKVAAFNDACQCLNEVWEEKIHGPFAKDLSSLYPFAPSDKEATVAQVQNLLGNQQGVLWFEDKEIRPAREEGMRFSPDYDSLAAQAKNLFSGVDLSFSFTLEADAPHFRALSGRGVVQEAQFSLGSQPPFSYRMGVKVPWQFQWKAVDPNTELSLKVQNLRCDPKSYSGPWALFRLFDEAKLDAGQAAWDFNCGGFTYRAEYSLDGAFLARGHFKNLKLPEKICQ